MPIDPVVGGAIIGAGASALNAIGTGNMNRKNRKFAVDLYNADVFTRPNTADFNIITVRHIVDEWPYSFLNSKYFLEVHM